MSQLYRSPMRHNSSSSTLSPPCRNGNVGTPSSSPNKRQFDSPDAPMGSPMKKQKSQASDANMQMTSFNLNTTPQNLPKDSKLAAGLSTTSSVLQKSFGQLASIKETEPLGNFPMDNKALNIGLQREMSNGTVQREQQELQQVSDEDNQMPSFDEDSHETPQTPSAQLGFKDPLEQRVNDYMMENFGIIYPFNASKPAGKYCNYQVLEPQGTGGGICGGHYTKMKTPNPMFMYTVQISGQTPGIDGSTYDQPKFRLEENEALKEKQAEQAQVCACNVLQSVKSQIVESFNINLQECDGKWSHMLHRVAKVNGFINTGINEFESHQQVMNGQSDVFMEVLGNIRGNHTRTAVGVASLPKGAPVQIDATVEIGGLFAVPGSTLNVAEHHSIENQSDVEVDIEQESTDRTLTTSTE